MKKTTAIILILVLLVSLAGCAKKTASTPDAFTNYFQQKGFEVADITERDYSEYKDIVSSVIIAANGNYRLEYFKFTSNENAENAFEDNKATVENVSGGATSSYRNGATAEINKTGNGEYYTVRQADDTMIYVHCSDAYKNDVDEHLKNLGY